MNNLPINAKHAINARSEAILSDIMFMIERGEISDIDGCYTVVDDTHLDDAAAIYLDLDEQLTLLEWHADDYGLEFDDVSLGELRMKIEGYAASLVCILAQAEARSAVRDLETFLDENGFEFEEIASRNGYEWARHYAEREEDDAQVYEYRDVEGEIHVDVWEYVVSPGITLFLNRALDAEDVTPEGAALRGGIKKLRKCHSVTSQ